jgi:hypothetical protein
MPILNDALLKVVRVVRVTKHLFATLLLGQTCLRPDISRSNCAISWPVFLRTCFPDLLRTGVDMLLLRLLVDRYQKNCALQHKGLMRRDGVIVGVARVGLLVARQTQNSHLSFQIPIKDGLQYVLAALACRAEHRDSPLLQPVTRISGFILAKQAQTLGCLQGRIEICLINIAVRGDTQGVQKVLCACSVFLQQQSADTLSQTLALLIDSGDKI